MKRYFILAILFSIVVSMFFANETIEGFTLGGGKVILRNDGTWEWSEKPERYKNFNIVSPVQKTKARIWSFEYESFLRNNENAMGKYYRIYGMVDKFYEQTNGYFIKIYTNKQKYFWDREIYVIEYDDFDLHVGDLVELVVKYNSNVYETSLDGKKQEIPLFVWTEDSTIYLK